MSTQIGLGVISNAVLMVCVWICVDYGKHESTIKPSDK